MSRVVDRWQDRQILIPRMSRRLYFEACEEFDFRLLFALSYVAGGGAEVAECLAAVDGVGDFDFEAWHEGWKRVAERVSSEAASDEAAGRAHSARAGHMRAANYFYQAGFFLRAGSSEFLDMHRRSVAAFEAAASLPGPEFRRTHVPFEGASLPAWFFPAEKGRRSRTLIALTGTDATNEQLYYFAGGRTAAARGWNLLCVSGPGQFSTLSVHPEMVFRPDYETVIGPVLDHLTGIAEVDPDGIALLGFSKGGYLAPRCAAAEPRIKALVANGPVTNFHDAIWPGVQRMMDHSGPMSEWVTAILTWIYGAPNMSRVKRIMQDYNLDGKVEQIACPTLILGSQGEGPTKRAQAREFASRLNAPHESRFFTKEEGADAHCQIGNWTLMHQVVFDWLDKTLPDRGGALA